MLLFVECIVNLCLLYFFSKLKPSHQRSSSGEGLNTIYSRKNTSSATNHSLRSDESASSLRYEKISRENSVLSRGASN